MATRRKDRIDPKKYSGLSIVDLAVAFDKKKKDEMFMRAAKFEEEEREVMGSDLLIGNRNDQDAEVFSNEDS